MSDKIKNYYQGIFVTETVMGNPNGDFVDNSPRNIDGNVFTTDKCIKYNIRNYIHSNYENIEENENMVFFYPRLQKDAKPYESKFLTRDQVFNEYFNKKFEDVLENAVDVKMFGGTFSLKGTDPKQIYGPIQISYGLDINDAQIKKLQIGAPFANKEGSQKTIGTESVVDDAIITYDIIINPNNYPELLSENNLKLFKEALWYGTNSRKTTSKKTDAKVLILIKFKNEKDTIKSFNIGELKETLSIKNKNERLNHGKIVFDTTNLIKKLETYEEYIDSIDIYRDKNEVDIQLDCENIQINYHEPKELL
ncbi:type I CRISPR-associated protein Cas7 [Methanosphaera stadtmanae]|uniref:type I CRISPR-associated protein Cas7 n=1 Tax=Methanosphaera stadtmanae TaxID=2317 RepID=UPI0026744D7A|nr:type I CRISPR-associated protein Cas7 [Methanosphaera stadtmanae]